MTKVKFEVGKEYIDNHGENYTVVSRDAEFVTVEPVGFFSSYKCEVAEDANGNEEIKEIKVGRVKSTLKANFGLTEIKARVDMQEKALAKAVEAFEAKLNAGLNLNRLVIAAGNIGYCLEEIARMENLMNAVAEVVTVDLSNAAGTENAEKQICAALQNNSLTDSDYALVKMVRKMISEIVADDEVSAKLVAEGKISREYYDATAYTSEEFKTITLDNTFGMREWAAAKDLMDFAGVTEEDYHISWGKGLIRGFNFNRNAVAKAVIYALNLAGITADGRTDYNKVDANEYVVSVDAQDAAVESEIENAKNAAVEIKKFEIGGLYRLETGTRLLVVDRKKSLVTVANSRGVKVSRQAKILGNSNVEEFIPYTDKRQVGEDANKFLRADCLVKMVDLPKKESANVKIDASEYVVSVEAQEVAINAEIENAQAAEVEEISPSIEKIFATVTTEIKPHIRGKYFVQIDDNWREQEIRENFSTLEDAVKVARIMYSELRKVSRHIYATVEARTVDINKLWNRADDWTTFYEINSDGEKINRRETIAVIAKIDNRTVEEVRNDIGRYGDNYGFYKNSVAEVETEKNSLKAKVAEILNRPRKPIIDWKATFEDMQVLEILSLQKDLKKFLKLGEIDLAENVFSMLKTLCRNYRAVAA